MEVQRWWSWWQLECVVVPRGGSCFAESGGIGFCGKSCKAGVQYIHNMYSRQEAMETERWCRGLCMALAAAAAVTHSLPRSTAERLLRFAVAAVAVVATVAAVEAG